MIALALGFASLRQTPPPSAWPQTRAERTNYAETSHYSDVIDFITSLQHLGAPISVQYFGTTTEGRKMPLVIAARPMVANAAEARRTGKPIIYIQANIHAGEVEGKEAAMMVLRRACQEKTGLLDKVILLVDPIYNIDGNEKFGPMARNRPEQDGPELVGVRANGQGLDLNRDGIKAESPEFRAVLSQIWNTWDPDVMMDLHTTDGTRHGYDLTYAPPMNPNTPPGIMKFSRDEMLPSIRRELKRKFNQELFDYGDATKRDKETVWSTFGEGGRYMTNYAGLRNRIGILSEATTYISFHDRVVSTDYFVTAVLEYVARNSRKVLELTRSTSLPAELGVRFTMAPGRTEEARLEPPMKTTPWGRPKEIVKVKMPIYERFVATKSAPVPAAYLIPESETKLIELLGRHGIVVERLLSPWSAPVDQFTLTAVKVDGGAFQGHKLMQLEGTYARVTTGVPAGSYLVRTNQPLGVLIFNMLEPESSDGAATWGFLTAPLAPGVVGPIQKLPSFPATGPVTEKVVG